MLFDLGQLALASLFGLGVALLTYTLAQERAHAARTRRLRGLLGPDIIPAAPERADITSRPLRLLGELMRARPVTTQRLAISLSLLGLLAGLATGGLAWLGLLAVGLALLARLRVETRVGRELDQQAPAAIEMMAAGLRAGYSIQQAIALVARESPPATAAEFARVEREIELGNSLSVAMTQLAERCRLPDYELVSTIIAVQSQIGGNLPLLLDSVVATLHERVELRQHIHTFTAQQRLTSTILSLLPLGVLACLLAVDRPFVEPLFTNPVGRLMLVGCAILLFLGWSSLRSLSRVDL